MVSKMQLPLERRQGTVKVANGDKVTNLGLCTWLSVQIAEEQFSLTCYALPLEGFDVVLGVQWLRSLGLIPWDFERLSMTFWKQDRKVCWTGMCDYKPRCCAFSEGKELVDKLLYSYEDLFA